MGFSSFRSWLGRTLPSTPRGAGLLGRRPKRSCRPSLEELEGRNVPATFVVTTGLDVVNPNDGRLSLREAISRADHHAGADTVVLPAGVFRISMAGSDDANAAGDFDVTDSVTIRGAGAGRTILDGQRLDRVLDVLGTAPHSVKVTLEGLSVADGQADDGGGVRVGNADLMVRDCAITGNRATGDGGGVSNAGLPGTGNVTVVRSVVSRNAANFGGGLWVRGNSQDRGSLLTVIGSTVRLNTATTDGGGIRAATVNLTGSTVAGNTVTVDDGGGISATVAAHLTNCTVSGNHSGFNGGGLDAQSATVINSTFSGNSSTEFGGGINANSLTATGSTVTGNHAATGGGIAAGVATVMNSTVSGNTGSDAGGGVFATRLSLIRSAVNHNTAGGDGGGIDSDTLTVVGGMIRGNTAGRNGGGIEAETVTLANATVGGNSADSCGGGIYANVKGTLLDSTLGGNSATGSGGGIYVNGTGTLTNVTLSGNHSGDQGGAISAVNVTLLNVTATDNDAHTGGGIFFEAGGAFNVRNTLIAGNFVDAGGSDPDVAGSVTSGGHNLIGDGTGSVGFTNGMKGDMVGTAAHPIDPRLGPLANNGGPTLTHAPLPGSPAIDHGDNADLPATDQRGVARPRDGDGNGSRVADIGAFER